MPRRDEKGHYKHGHMGGRRSGNCRRQDGSRRNTRNRPTGTGNDRDRGRGAARSAGGGRGGGRPG